MPSIDLIEKIGKTFNLPGDQFPRKVFSICADMYDHDQKQIITITDDDPTLVFGIMRFFQRYSQVIPKGMKLQFGNHIVSGTGYKDHAFDETFDSIKGKPLGKGIHSFTVSDKIIENPKKIAIYGEKKEKINHEEYLDRYGSTVFTSIAYNRLTVQMNKLNKNKEIPEEIRKPIKEKLEILLRRDFEDDEEDEKLILLAELARLINEIFTSENKPRLEYYIEQYDFLISELNNKPFFKEHYKFFEKLKNDDIYLKYLEKNYEKKSVDDLLQGKVKHAEEGDKTKFLNKLANKIHDLEKRGGQNAKKIALCGIYFHFKKFDFSPQSKANLLELIQEKHEQLKTFDSTVGQIGAFIKQFFFHPRKEKRNDTENIIEELVDFINSQKQAPKSKKISR